jgi:hypothetical protein
VTSLPSPNLDDRDFDQLLAESLRRVRQSCPEWTDLSPSDPGVVLLELFAHLTETMIYRLNRLPEKAYVAFLNMIGVRIKPPAAASVMLRFTSNRDNDQAIEIPRGTRVTVSRGDTSGEPPVFTTARTVTIPEGETQAECLAWHADLIEAELAGHGTGEPGFSIQVQRPPIIAPTGDELDLMVAVEASPDELSENAPVIQYGPKAYRVWREVQSFTNLGPDRHVYVADRNNGRINFSPAARMTQEHGGLADIAQALAEVPGFDREVRVWYRRGGGLNGNVAAGALTVLRDNIPGIEVTNPARATGGQPAETLQNALLRGPQELRSLERAVTARDFELIALNTSRSVARARAFTRVDLWAHALPGTVEVLLVPHLSSDDSASSQVTVGALQELQTETARQHVQTELNERRTMGTACVVNWTNYKIVRVSARVVVRREENAANVRERVLARLYQAINPLPTNLNPSGWPFGQTLRASHVYDIALAEPGVLWADRVRFTVDEVPDEGVTCVAADVWQSRTWYAGSGGSVFRSLNDGDSWESIASFEGESVGLISTSPDIPGLVAVATRLSDGSSSRIHISTDCGETWGPVPVTLDFGVEKIAWALRENEPLLLMATDTGLYELNISPGSGPVQVLVDEADLDKGFYAVAAARNSQGQLHVLVAAQGTQGVFLSNQAGQPNTFRHVGLQGTDVRVLAVQHIGPRSFFWAGAAAYGEDDDGTGCFRWEFTGSEDPPERWRHFSSGWSAGSCMDIAFLDIPGEPTALAATYRGGVLRLVGTLSDNAQWQGSDVRNGLPLRDLRRFRPVESIAVGPEARRALAAGSEGVFRSDDRGLNYQQSSAREFIDRVTLPPTWLFCSGEHDLMVVSEDEAE